MPEYTIQRLTWTWKTPQKLWIDLKLTLEPLEKACKGYGTCIARQGKPV